jgi:hypothetical protein
VRCTGFSCPISCTIRSNTCMVKNFNFIRSKILNGRKNLQKYIICLIKQIWLRRRRLLPCCPWTMTILRRSIVSFNRLCLFVLLFTFFFCDI